MCRSFFILSSSTKRGDVRSDTFVVCVSHAVKSDSNILIEDLKAVHLPTALIHVKQLYFKACGGQASEMVSRAPSPCVTPSPFAWQEPVNVGSRSPDYITLCGKGIS